MHHRLTRRTLLGTATAAAMFPFAAYVSKSQASASSEPSATIQDFVNQAVLKHQLPGAGLAYIENGQVAWEAGFGVKNVSTSDPVTPQTLFQAASLSKPLFAYVVLQLVDSGAVALDDFLVDYFRPGDLGTSPWLQQIRIRDALQHTSGLPNWRSEVDWIEPLEPAFEPGTNSEYSGEAYHWLQQVAETITGQGLDSLMRDRLFQHAGLQDMQMFWSPNRDEREVYTHKFDDGGALIVHDLQYKRLHTRLLADVAARWQHPMTNWTSWDQKQALSEMAQHTNPRLKAFPSWEWARPGIMMINSASSLRCTPGDYARFMCLMFPGSDRQPWQVFEQTRALMLTPQYERPDVQGGVLPRGLGWGLEKRPDGIAFYHWGKNGASHHAVALGDAVRGKGIVVMTHGPNGKAFIREVVTELMGENYIGITT